MPCFDLIGQIDRNRAIVVLLNHDDHEPVPLSGQPLNFDDFFLGNSQSRDSSLPSVRLRAGRATAGKQRAHDDDDNGAHFH